MFVMTTQHFKSTVLTEGGTKMTAKEQNGQTGHGAKCTGKHKMALFVILTMLTVGLSADCVWAMGVVSSSTDESLLQRDPTFSIAAVTGFPGVIGVSMSYWPLNWLTLDAVAEISLGVFTTAGAAVHLPLLRHGAHRHSLILAMRGGVVSAGNSIFPNFGPVAMLEGGYGWLGKAMNLRLLAGVQGSHYGTPHHPFWESNPLIALRFGMAF